MVCFAGVKILHPRFDSSLRVTRFYGGKEKSMATATKAKKKSGSKINIQPLGDRIVLQREDSEDTTAGGIVLPESAKDKPARGTVLSVGPGKLLDDGSRGEIQIQVGDRVLFSSYAGESFEVEDEELLLMREDDILAVIE